MKSNPLMIPMETVKDIADWLLWRPGATVMDIMAEFDLTDMEAFFALVLARHVVHDMETERAKNRSEQ